MEDTMEEDKMRVKVVDDVKQAVPRYEAPKMVTYTNEQIFQWLGPAQAGSPGGRDSLGG